jgi:hypothetical protein
VVLLTLHLVFEFAAWAHHPGNQALGHKGAIPWQVASFPLSLSLGERVATNFFWELMLANRRVWSLSFTAIPR